MKLDAFTRGFLEAALWSSNDESDDYGGNPLDDNFTIDDIDATTLANLVAECARFQLEHAADIEAVYNGCHNPRSWVEAQFGHDFWLTRNGHGCGFWDGDYPEEMGERLTAASKAYGEVYLYVVGDAESGTIYAAGYETIKVCA